MSKKQSNSYNPILNFLKFYFIEILLILALIIIYVKYDDIQNLILFITAIIILFQLKYASRGYHRGNEIASRIRAIELSEYYRKEILEPLSYISYVFDISGISNEINKIKHENLNSFTNDELNNLYGKELLVKIINACEFIDLSNILEMSISFKTLPFEVQTFFISNHKIDYKKLVAEYELKFKNAEDQNEKNLHLINIENVQNDYNKIVYCKRIINDEYTTMLHDVANKLEYFSMHFTNGIADDIVIYQSIHQTYLAAVKMLYPIIARSNENAHNSYYNNIKELYLEWSQISCDNAKKEAKLRQSNITRRNKIKK